MLSLDTSIGRPVMGDERVPCPRLGFVALARCERCEFLHTIERDADGAAERLVCAPSYRALAGQDL